jgi:hypothetical protein
VIASVRPGTSRTAAIAVSTAAAVPYSGSPAAASAATLPTYSTESPTVARPASPAPSGRVAAVPTVDGEVMTMNTMTTSSVARFPLGPALAWTVGGAVGSVEIHYDVRTGRAVFRAQISGEMLDQLIQQIHRAEVERSVHARARRQRDTKEGGEEGSQLINESSLDCAPGRIQPKTAPQGDAWL